MNSGSGPLLAASAILGVCILGAGYFVGSAVQDASSTLGEVQLTLVELAEEFEGMAAAPPAREAAAPRRGPDPNKNYTLKTAGSPALGPDDAKVTVIEFSDFQCPFCSRVYPTLQRLRQEYGDTVRVVFKHLPLDSIHPRARSAHAASEAAKLQGKFWEMHDKIFANQRSLSDERYLEFAKEIGLDVERFKRDLASAPVKARVDADAAEAASLGVTGTPAFFINGKHMSGARPYPDFKRMVDAALEG